MATRPLTLREKRARLSTLIESGLEKAELVLAVKAITDKLQDMAEDLAKIEADDIMPMADPLKTAFGPQMADQFGSSATEQVRSLVTAISTAKDAIGNQVSRLESAVDGAPGNDMAADLPDDDLAEPALGGDAADLDGDDATPAASGKAADGLGDLSDDMPPLDDKMNAAGRAAKESVLDVRRIRRLMENYRSSSFDANLSNLGNFDARLGTLAHSVAGLIENGRFDGSERSALANVLSHLASCAQDERHWEDPEAKTEAALQAAHVDMRLPDVRKIVVGLKKLAHGISFKHEGMMESRRSAQAVAALRGARDPDALVRHAFCRALSETRNPTLALRQVTERFRIDATDVVAIVRAAKAVRETAARKRRVAEAQPMGARSPAQMQVDRDAKRQADNAGKVATGQKTAPAAAATSAPLAAAQSGVAAPAATATTNGQVVAGAAARRPTGTSGTTPVGQTPAKAAGMTAASVAGTTTTATAGTAASGAPAGATMPGKVVSQVAQPKVSANTVKMMSKGKAFPKAGPALVGGAAVSEAQSSDKRKGDPCWKGYKQVGTKKKGGKDVPNCVPTREARR